MVKRRETNKIMDTENRFYWSIDHIHCSRQIKAIIICSLRLLALNYSENTHVEHAECGSERTFATKRCMIGVLEGQSYSINGGWSVWRKHRWQNTQSTFLVMRLVSARLPLTHQSNWSTAGRWGPCSIMIRWRRILTIICKWSYCPWPS